MRKRACPALSFDFAQDEVKKAGEKNVKFLALCSGLSRRRGRGLIWKKHEIATPGLVKWIKPGSR